MWKPNDVVTEHKKRATMVWVGLLASIAAFVVWQSVALFKKYENPSTSFSVSDDIYNFPYTEVCFGNYNGCSWDGCIESVHATVVDPCDEEWDVQIPSPGNSDSCVTFDMEQVEPEGFRDRGCIHETQKPFMTIQILWIANNDTQQEEAYRSRVSVFLGGELVEALTLVPYSRVERPEEGSATEISIPQTDMTMGKSTRSFLSGDTVTNYPALTTSTTYDVYRNQSALYNDIYDYLVGSYYDSSSSIGEDPAFGFMFLSLALGSFSLTKLSDENPINMLDFIANIGGFWEVLLVAWGVFFITRHNDTGPKQEARNFAEAIKRGFERNNSSVDVAGPSPSSAVVSQAERDGEEHPNGGITPGGPRHASSNNIGGRASVDESTV